MTSFAELRVFVLTISHSCHVQSYTSNQSLGALKRLFTGAASVFKEDSGEGRETYKRLNSCVW